MAIIDPLPDVRDAAYAARRIRTFMITAIDSIDDNLRAVHQLVQTHGRNAVASALGADADDFASAFASLRSCLLDIDASRNVPELPT